MIYSEVILIYKNFLHCFTPSDKYLIAMKYLETMTAITSGEGNKVVYMPYEATGILSSVDGIKEMFKGTK